MPRRLKQPAGRSYSTACPDWEARITSGRSLIPFDPLYPDEAADALLVFDALRLVDVVGQPTFGEAARPWVREIPAALFGSYDPETGRRAIRSLMLLVSKKNGKSTLAAGIMLTALIRNWRPSGEFGMLAPTIEAADNCFRPVRDMIRADEDLDALLHIQEHTRTVTHRENGGTLKVVAAEHDTVSGKKWIGTLVDELWAFGKKPRASDMLREATGGMASRPEGFVIYLSTHAAEPAAGVFLDKLRYARDVRDGRISDPTFLPILYEFPRAMQDAQTYRDPQHWHITNPNLGASVDEAFLATRWAEEEAAGEGRLREHIAKHLNVEVGLSLLSNRWAGADYWEQQARPGGVTLQDVLERCDVVEVGIDGGGLDDMLGLCVAGRERDSGHWLAWFRAWLHPIALERRKAESARFMDFARAGDLVIVERIGEDVEQVVSIVLEVEASGLLDKVGVDAVGIGAIVDGLTDGGIPIERIVAVSQGWRLAGAIKTCERKLAEGALWHSGAPLMAWCVGNAKVEPKGNAVMITKQISGLGKIDPVMAMLNAAELLSRAPANVMNAFLAYVGERANEPEEVAT